MALPKLDWQTVQLDTMPPKIATAYKAYRKTVEATNKERVALEDTIKQHLSAKKLIPAGMEPRFGYRWGKLAIAFAEPGSAKSAEGSEGFSF
jgi:hypothetical protein